MNRSKNYQINKVVYPIQKFIQNEKSGGLVLGISVLIALILANSPLAHGYHHFLEHSFGFQWDGKTYLEYDYRRCIGVYDVEKPG